jgi:hypothetical protein
VKFNTSTAGFVVDFGGTISARGSQLQPIVFTSGAVSQGLNDWRGIVFNAAATGALYDANGNYVNGSIFEWCQLERGARNYNSYYSMLTLYSVPVHLSYVSFANNYYAAIYMDSITKPM